MKYILLALGFFAGIVHAQAQTFVASVSPAPYAQNVRSSANIIISFTADINPGTLTQSTVKVSGSLSGPHAFRSLSYTGAARTAVIDPAADFSAGEVVTVVLTQGVQNILGDPMPGSFISQFFVASKVGSGMLMQGSVPGAGNQPWAVATIDPDHDGAFDFLVLNRTERTVSLIQNYGAGNYLKVSSKAVGTQPSALATADLNGDDNADCIVANEGSNTVTMLFLDGRGVFTRSDSFAVSGAPSAVIASDIDGDGDADLIVAGRSSKTVSVYRNNGLGTFTVSSSTVVGAGPSALVAGDFNGDAALDIAVASESANTVTVLLNNGAGTFTALTPATVTSGPVSLCAGDFDNDGSIDLAAAGKTSNSISVLRNDGSGNFYTASILPSVTAPNTVAAGDMDGDGNCDIVGIGSGVAVFRNQGYFQFQSLAPVSGGTSPHGLVIADLDGDGDLDCAVPNSLSSSLSLFMNRPAVSASVVPGTIDFGVSRSGLARQIPVSIRNDGVQVPLKIMSVASSNPSVFSCEAPSGLIAPLDSVSMTVTFKPSDVKNYSDSLTLVTNDPVRPTVKVYLKAIGGLVVLSTLPAAGASVTDGAAAVNVFFNGMLDLASVRNTTVRLYGDITGLHTAQLEVNNTERKAIVTPGQKFVAGEHVTGVLTDSVTASVSSIRLLDGFAWNYRVQPLYGSEYYNISGTYATGASPYAAAAGDFNRDGYADIAVVNSGDNTLSVFMNDKHGALESAHVYALGQLPQALVVADLNEDGAPDIAAVNTSGNSVSILLNLNAGDGRFNPSALVLATGIEPRALAAGDLNNDGHLDLVVANAKDNTVSIFTNDGAAHFALFKTIGTGASPRAAAVADLNNDGSLDIVLMNRQANSITVVLNARGTFTSATYGVGTMPVAMTVNDFNRDGYYDVATANSGSKDLSILLNTGSGAFSSASTVPMYNVPTAIYSGDMSGDGAQDLVVAQYSSASPINTVQVLTNTGHDSFVRGDSIVVNSPVTVTGFDLNNRGILHLAVSNLLTNGITIVNPSAAQTPIHTSPAHESVSLKPPVALQWQTTARTIVYHVQVSEASTGALIVDDTTVTLQNYSIPALAFSTTFQWRVRAKNNVGWGDFSQWWNFSTCIAPPPSPMPTAPEPYALEQNEAPLFAWQPSPTAEQYRIQAGEDSIFATIAFDATTNDPFWQSAPLKIHTPYFWRVKAINFGGESPWCDVRSFTTLLPLPQQVRLQAPSDQARPGTSSITFTWHAAQWEVKRYWFEIAADSLFIFRIVDSSVHDTVWQMPRLSGNQRYFWKVRALNDKGWGSFSETYSFSLGATSVEKDGQLPVHFALDQNFPNPFNPSTQIRFSIPSACLVRLTVYDILGREAATLVNESLAPGVYSATWNAQGLPSGVYICRLTAGTYVSTRKLSLQK